jgi:hypothetical protein
MKAKLDAKPLRDAIKTSAVLLGPETNLLLTVEGDALIIESGSGGTYMKQILPADVEEEGHTVLAINYVQALKFDGVVTIEADQSQMHFKSGAFKGKVAAGGDKEEILDQRPLNPFEAKVALPAEVFKNAVRRVSFGNALPGAQVGIRVQVNDHLTVSTTDQFRATLFKEELAVEQEEFDVLLSPAFLQLVLGRIDDYEVNIGAHKGTFQVRTETLQVYHPTIQQEPEDIEGWINTGIDPSQKKGSIMTLAEDLSKSLVEVTSITAGSLDFDTYVDVLVKKKKMAFRCQADHGSSQSHLALEESDCRKHQTKLSSRYTLEMINLIKAGELEIEFWDDFILLSGFSGKFKGVLPTVA